ncbi:calmodulin-like protein 3 [Durio zibethinus]|uniref:Calmodulin-like protein 3 n=1 Tax=Durio zibethinus TaxID=66656 RepID=A0A6P5ZH51_DURZI|nr:calmodulin-like protein 3 [Durio zibethinus]
MKQTLFFLLCSLFYLLLLGSVLLTRDMVTSLLLLAVLFIAGFINIYYHFPSKKFYAWLQSFFPNSCSSSSAVSSKTTQVISVMERSDPKKVELKSVFATFDKNGDGFITKQELGQSFKNIRLFMTEKEVEEMVMKVDANGDGLIDFDEFCTLCQAMNNHDEKGVRKGEDGNGVVEDGDGEGELKEAFDVFDKDKDGLISVEELGSVLCSLGLKEGNKMEDCKAMIRRVDMDGDGMVNFDEFKRMMKSEGGLVSISAF